MARIIDERDHRFDVGRRPIPRHEGFARLPGILRGADEPDHLIDIAHRDCQPDQDMRAVARLAQEMLGAPGDHLLAEGNERGEQVLEIHDQRAPAVKRHDIGAESRLQGRVAVELVENHVGHCIAPKLNHHAISGAVGLVAQRRYAFDLLVAPKLADALDHRSLVHLVGNLADDDRLTVATQRLDVDLASGHDRAAAEMIGGADALATKNDAARWEVGTGYDPDQLIDSHGRIVDQRDAGVDHLAEIVGRDIGGHADGDAAGAVDQKVRKARRQDNRLFFIAVVIGLEIDRILVDVLKQLHGRAGQAAFGVAHRRGWVAVDGAEVSLPVNERQAHGKVLRHAHQGVVDRLVAVRVIFAHHVAHHARRFHVFLVGRVPALMHGIENAPVHRLESVADIRQRARHDDAHGVIEVAALHLFRDGDGTNIGRAGLIRLKVFAVGQGRISTIVGARSLPDCVAPRHPGGAFSNGYSIAYGQDCYSRAGVLWPR